LRDGIQLSNGLGWSPDGATIYHIDTYAKTLSSHSYGAGGFDHDEPWVAIPAEFPGYPDGMRVDAEGMLWVAQFSGGCVVRYAPDGRELARVLVDAQQPTCVGFVGERLVITSAIEHLTPEERVPADGALFLADVGVAGVPPHRWTGSTRT
ncbi:SMP-30/gluconolactonase/LRE family protein, partial [Vibrio cidicii]|uniref:SMP-30/gluconolactonase/LRE family protein n=1 Tax=Vibrio cidicii TaxID=1763883 RepID=UPI003703DA89